MQSVNIPVLLLVLTLALSLSACEVYVPPPTSSDAPIPNTPISTPTPHIAVQATDVHATQQAAQANAAELNRQTIQLTAEMEDTVTAHGFSITQTADAIAVGVLQVEATGTTHAMNDSIEATEVAKTEVAFVAQVNRQSTQSANDAETTRRALAAEQSATLSLVFTRMLQVLMLLVVGAALINYLWIRETRRIRLNAETARGWMRQIYEDAKGNSWMIDENEDGTISFTLMRAALPIATGQSEIIENEPETIPIREGGKTVSHIEADWRSPLSREQNGARSKALGLLRLSVNELGEHTNRILPASECPSSNETWSQIVHSLEPHIETKQGRTGGTWIAKGSEYRIIFSLLRAIQKGQFIPSVSEVVEAA